jgi:hypothetical protein
MQLSTVLTGGFLAGKRTYLLAILAVLTELIHWAVGDQSLGALLDHLPTMLGELSIATLRAGVANWAEDAGVTASVLADIGKPTPAEMELLNSYRMVVQRHDAFRRILQDLKIFRPDDYARIAADIADQKEQQQS